MASGPITTWQIEWEKVGVMTDFLFLGSQITANSGCSRDQKTIASWQDLSPLP